LITWINKATGLFAEADLRNPSLRQFVAHAAFAIERARTTARLRYLADYDQMTELVHRDRFPGFVRRRLEELGGEYVHLAILDLDRFKRVNDRHGHLAGDEIIKLAAGTIRDHARRSVVPSHWGGDEFALALAADAAGEGEEFVERLRRAIDPDAPDEGHPPTQPRRHDGLVGALAAGCLLEHVADDGVAGLGQPQPTHEEAGVGAADHDDVPGGRRHGGRLLPERPLRSRPVGSRAAQRVPPRARRLGGGTHTAGLLLGRNRRRVLSGLKSLLETGRPHSSLVGPTSAR
jgi:GGDEF domain-containing protein